MSLTRGDVIADTPLTHGPLTWAEEQWVEENFQRISERLQASHADVHLEAADVQS